MPPLSVDLISDLHLDNWEGTEMVYKPNPGVKVAVVAGDLNSSPEFTARELRKIREAYPIVLVIDGNNESRLLLEKGLLRPGDVAAGMRKEIAGLNKEFGDNLGEDIGNKRWDADSKESRGIWYLNDGPFVDKDTGAAIIGRNGWWDYAVDPRIKWQDAVKQQFVRVYSMLNPGELPAAGTVPESLLADIRTQLERQKLATGSSEATEQKHIEVTPADIAASRKQALKDFRDLRDEMLSLNKDDNVKSVAVVTHTVPQIPGTGLLDFGGGKWSPLTMSTMANTLMHKLGSRKYDLKGKFGTYMFGHQHANRDEMHDGVRYISHPIGRPGEILQKGNLLLYTPEKVEIEPRHATGNPAIATARRPAAGRGISSQP